MKSSRELVINGTDLSFGEGQHQVRTRGLSRWKISRKGKSWTVKSLSVSQSDVSLDSKSLRVQGSFLRDINGTLPSMLELRSASGLSFDLIASLSLRDYLIGVVAHEMPPQWPLETLKAQSVAARSYTLRTREERKSKPWHVEATIEDQVFRDPSMRADLESVRKAVRETDGILLLDPKRRTLKAFYHADCGGRTVASQSVWGGGVDTGTAIDPQCPSGPGGRWTYRIKAKDFLNRLEAGGQRLMGLESLTAGAGGRAEKFRLRLPARTVELNANELRLKVGSTQLKSTRFVMQQNGDELVFKGQGFGHGVGLCQWGSRHLGQHGLTFEKILAHYYPKALIEHRDLTASF
ncbi:MAG: SpoIID/LytB domain-containing protein [Bdellovibrionaceae bacterium]|nr:SpoIID/LytB domain-containing protein [Pseudobdellovibrionaceae bacterium]